MLSVLCAITSTTGPSPMRATVMRPTLHFSKAATNRRSSSVRITVASVDCRQMYAVVENRAGRLGRRNLRDRWDGICHDHRTLKGGVRAETSKMGVNCMVFGTTPKLLFPG